MTQSLLSEPNIFLDTEHLLPKKFQQIRQRTVTDSETIMARDISLDGQFQFVTFTRPGGPNAAASARRANAHAARVSHARRRQTRMIKFQKEAPVEKSGPEAAAPEVTAAPEMTIVRQIWRSQVESRARPALASPSPQDCLSSFRKDPFLQPIRPLQRTEHALLDYCSSSAITPYLQVGQQLT